MAFQHPTAFEMIGALGMTTSGHGGTLSVADAAEAVTPTARTVATTAAPSRGVLC
jgi:hypothetical protein